MVNELNLTDSVLTSSKIIVEAQREVGPAAAKIAYDKPEPSQITVSIHFSALCIPHLTLKKI
jgi:hypothetical protein